VRLSAFVPNRNYGRFVGGCIEAILAQSRPADEIHLVDDASTDDSARVMAAYAARDPARIRFAARTQNRGVVRLMNDSLAMSDCECHVMCASDDRVIPGFFKRAMTLMEAYPTAGFCSGLIRMIDQDGRDIGPANAPVPFDRACFIPPEEAKRLLLRIDSWFAGGATVFRRTALQEIGGFDEELRSLCDGFASRVLAMRHGVCFVPYPVMAWRPGRGSLSATINSNAEVMLEVLARATGLMRGRHADAVPEAYVRAFERRIRFMIGSAVVLENAARQSDGIERLMGAGRAFGLGALIGVSSTLARVLLFLRYRSGEIPATIARLVRQERYRRRWPAGRFVAEEP